MDSTIGPRPQVSLTACLCPQSPHPSLREAEVPGRFGPKEVDHASKMRANRLLTGEDGHEISQAGVFDGLASPHLTSPHLSRVLQTVATAPLEICLYSCPRYLPSRRLPLPPSLPQSFLGLKQIKILACCDCSSVNRLLPITCPVVVSLRK